MERPGDKITPATFAVVPDLLGKPLASPTARALAMGIDLLLLAILVNAGGLFFALAAGFVLWRASARTGFAARRPKLGKLLRIGAVGLVFILVVTHWSTVTSPFRRLLDRTASIGSSSDDQGDEQQAHGLVVAAGDGKAGNVKISSLASLVDFVGLRRASSKEEADRIARRMVRQLKEGGVSAADVRAVGQGFASDSEALPPMAAQALKEAIAAELPADTQAAAPSAPASDSLAAAFVRAFRKRDSVALAQVRPRLGVALAADTLAILRGRVQDLEQRNQKLVARTRADSAKLAGGAAGLMDTMADAGDELVKILRKAGLGFGWLGLYFTGFVALMKGQTPGKWAMRIRIVRLDGRPMGWWSALERFGGYAASVVTALGGFFQILWDKNRQAMHDKIAETVVVQE